MTKLYILVGLIVGMCIAFRLILEAIKPNRSGQPRRSRRHSPKDEGLVAMFLDWLFGLLKSQGSTSSTTEAPDASGPADLPYARKSYLLSKTEKSFYNVLLGAVPENCVVFAQVSVKAVLYVERGTDNYRGELNKIDRLIFDFLICDRQWLSPLLAIELDDSSHDQPKRQKRDEFLDDACAHAGLPLLHVPVKQAYDQRALRLQIEAARQISLAPKAAATGL